MGQLKRFGKNLGKTLERDYDRTMKSRDASRLAREKGDIAMEKEQFVQGEYDKRNTENNEASMDRVDRQQEGYTKRAGITQEGYTKSAGRQEAKEAKAREDKAVQETAVALASILVSRGYDPGGIDPGSTHTERNSDKAISFTYAEIEKIALENDLPPELLWRKVLSSMGERGVRMAKITEKRIGEWQERKEKALANPGGYIEAQLYNWGRDSIANMSPEQIAAVQEGYKNLTGQDIDPVLLGIPTTSTTVAPEPTPEQAAAQMQGDPSSGTGTIPPDNAALRTREIAIQDFEEKFGTDLSKYTKEQFEAVKRLFAE